MADAEVKAEAPQSIDPVVAAPADGAAPAAKAAKPSKKKGAEESDGRPLELSPQPAYIAHRIAHYEVCKARREAELAALEKVEIDISLRDGSVRKGTSFVTTPLNIAEAISKSLAGKVIVARVDGATWDLTRPLEKSCRLELLDFADEEAQKVFWHSSAHMLGEACERHYGCFLEHGPPTDDGFFYDMRVPNGEHITEASYPTLDKLGSKVAGEKQAFERLEMTKEELLEMFNYSDLKTYFIQSKIPDGTRSTVYRCGPLIDLCLGPHIPNTSRVKAFQVYKHSTAYWLGNAANESLERVYGISFPENKLMEDWRKFREEAARRDHRNVGRQQDLFFFHDLSPGSAFFLPHGTRIYNALQQFIRNNYWKRGFTEVITPNMFNVKLWERSGHWANYQEDMFSLSIENETFALKPMNCPGHCLMFQSRPRTHRDLPLRLADFGVLHRNEASGALSGLTRVRRFQQDDAHIFCMQEQIVTEVDGAMKFLKDVYGIFGFELSLALSTRPEKFLGEVETWDRAEENLKDCLNRSGFEWKLNPGDGAFYGPKIDIRVQDAMRRRHQCATIQLDFQLPNRFDLTYQKPDGTEARPVMVHRAVLGSVERMIAILTEHYAGKWPFWLSPRQICVIPVAPPFFEYANTVKQYFHDAMFYVDVDDGGDTLNKKIRNAELDHHNFIFVVGEKERDEGSVNVRTRDNKVHGTFKLEDIRQRLEKLRYTNAAEDKLD